MNRGERELPCLSGVHNVQPRSVPTVTTASNTVFPKNSGERQEHRSMMYPVLLDEVAGVRHQIIARA